MKIGTKVVIKDNSVLHGATGKVIRDGETLVLLELDPPVTLEYHMHGSPVTIVHKDTYRLIEDLEERSA